jgi:hypothetical protein
MARLPLKDGNVAGREVASVIGPDAIAAVAKGPAAKPNAVRVDELKGGEHVRVWINSAGTHYLVNLGSSGLGSILVIAEPCTQGAESCRSKRS